MRLARAPLAGTSQHIPALTIAITKYNRINHDPTITQSPAPPRMPRLDLSKALKLDTSGGELPLKLAPGKAKAATAAATAAPAAAAEE